jgi:hypothetical protein
VNPRYLRSLPQLFGRPVLSELAATGRSAAFAHLGDAAGLDLRAPLADVYESAYAHLLKGYRCEYVFKNVIAQTLLLKRHQWTEARLLTEFRVGIRKADVVILNGTSTVYEIKTSLDNLDRLPAQIDAYRRVFDRIYIVGEEEQAARMLEGAGDDVGMVALDSNGQLGILREAKSNSANTDPETILSGLRRAEYLEVVRAETGGVPDVPNGHLWRECVKLARNMDPQRVHAHMVRLLRARPVPQSLRTMVEQGPSSLAHALLTLGAGPAALARLDHALTAPAVA